MNHDELIKQAREAGYNDAHFDGMYLFVFCPCQCKQCREAYEQGQEQGIKDLLPSPTE